MAPPVKKTASEPKRIARGPLAVGAMVGRVLRPALGKRGMSDGALYARWAEVVGPELARYASPVKIARPQRGPGTLHLRLSSGSAAALIHHQTPVLIARINAFFGREVISDLRVIQGLAPKTRKPLAAEKPVALSDQNQAPFSPGPGLEKVDDPELRAALTRLGQAIANKTNS